MYDKSMTKELVKNILGYSAAVSLIITLIPQIYYIYKRKKADDISYFFFGLQILTCTLFLIYGILLEELPLIIANTLVLLQSFILYLFKYRYS